MNKPKLTNPQMLALRAASSLGVLHSTALGYQGSDGQHHSRVAVRNLVNLGLLERSELKGAHNVRVTRSGRQYFQSTIGCWFAGRERPVAPGYRVLSDEETEVLRLIVDHGKVFWDEDSRTYQALDGSGSIEPRTLRKMASLVWVAVTPKQYAEILPAGLRALERGSVPVL